MTIRRYQATPLEEDTDEECFLGDRDTVVRLIGGFCAKVEHLMHGGASSKEDFVAKSNGLILAYGDIFAGRVPAYSFPVGWNDVSLPVRLRVDLGKFWDARHAKWDDDPVLVFFEWLFVSMAEFIKRADGDDMLLEIIAKPTVQQAIHHLMGTEERL